MKTFLHLYRKDLRAVWPWLLGTALASALGLIFPVSTEHPPLFVRIYGNELWYYFLQIPGVVLIFLTVAQIIHHDPLVGGNGFILTRPAGRVSVLLEKIALIFSLVVLPAAVIRWGMFAPLSTGLGFSHGSVLFIEQCLWISCVAAIPLLAALWTERTPHFVLALAMGLVAALAIAVVMEQFDRTAHYSRIQLPLVPTEYGFLPLPPADFDSTWGINFNLAFVIWTMGALLTALAQARTLRKWPVAVLFIATVALVESISLGIWSPSHPTLLAQLPTAGVRLDSLAASIRKDDHSAFRVVGLNYVAAGLPDDETLLPVSAGGTVFSSTNAKGASFREDDLQRIAEDQLPRVGILGIDYEFYNRRIVANALKIPRSVSSPETPDYAPIFSLPTGHEPDPTRIEGNITFEVVRAHVVVVVPAKPDLTATAEFTRFKFGPVVFGKNGNNLNVELTRVFPDTMPCPASWSNNHSGFGPYTVVAYNPGDGVFYFDQRGGHFMLEETFSAYEKAVGNTSFNQSNVSAPDRPIPQIPASWLAQSQIYVLELEPVGLITLPFRADVSAK